MMHQYGDGCGYTGITIQNQDIIYQYIYNIYVNHITYYNYMMSEMDNGDG